MIPKIHYLEKKGRCKNVVVEHSKKGETKHTRMYLCGHGLIFRGKPENLPLGKKIKGLGSRGGRKLFFTVYSFVVLDYSIHFNYLMKKEKAHPF